MLGRAVPRRRAGIAGEPPPGDDRPGADSKAQDDFRGVVMPFVAKYCASCHGPEKPKAGLNLEVLRDEATLRTRRRAWQRVREYVEGEIMPPEDSPQPSRAEVGAARRRDQGGARPRRLRQAGQSRPRDDPPAQPCRVQQHDPGPAGDRGPARRRVPVRRRRLWLRQRGRRAGPAAAVDGALPGGSREDRRAGDRGERGVTRAGEARVAPEDHLPRAELAGRVSGRRPGDPGAVREPGLPAAGHARGGRPAGRDGRAGPGGRGELRARDPARRAGRAGLAALPLPRRAG